MDIYRKNYKIIVSYEEKLLMKVNEYPLTENGIDYDAVIELGILEDLMLPEKSLVNLFCSLRNFSTWQIVVRAVDKAGNKSPFSLGKFIRIDLEKIDFDPSDYLVNIEVDDDPYEEKVFSYKFHINIY